MDAREFANLQEAIAWYMWPIVQFLLAILLASSIFVSIYMFFAQTVASLTRARGGGNKDTTK